MAKSSIEWTNETWNPISGCTRVSSGCDNCYAVKMTKRLDAMGKEKYKGLVNIGKDHFNGVVKCHEDALELPLRWTKPRKVFVNSMSDLFHKEVPFEFIDKVFAVMALCPQHTFQILTKRPERMAEYFSHIDTTGFCTAARIQVVFESLIFKHTKDYPWSKCFSFDLQSIGKFWPLPNVWLGTSVEDQKTADERIPHLLRVPARVRFLSCEPLLGPVDICHLDYFANDNGETWLDGFDGVKCMQDHEGGGELSPPFEENNGVHWVICGGESGPSARPMHPDWVRSLRDQCRAAGVAFFFKQWGEWVSEYHPASDTNLHKSSDAFVTLIDEGRDYKGEYMFRVGKHKSGRLLDGVTHDEFPGVSNA